MRFWPRRCTSTALITLSAWISTAAPAIQPDTSGCVPEHDRPERRSGGIPERLHDHGRRRATAVCCCTTRCKTRSRFRGRILRVLSGAYAASAFNQYVAGTICLTPRWYRSSSLSRARECRPDSLSWISTRSEPRFRCRPLHRLGTTTAPGTTGTVPRHRSAPHLGRGSDSSGSICPPTTGASAARNPDCGSPAAWIDVASTVRHFPGRSPPFIAGTPSSI